MARLYTGRSTEPRMPGSGPIWGCRCRLLGAGTWAGMSGSTGRASSARAGGSRPQERPWRHRGTRDARGWGVSRT
eukprot:5144102-Pleurochrysis_carterae.AAC.1